MRNPDTSPVLGNTGSALESFSRAFCRAPHLSYLSVDPVKKLGVHAVENPSAEESSSPEFPAGGDERKRGPCSANRIE